MRDAGVNKLLKAATACAMDAQLLCEDLSQLLFPRVADLPTEAVQASVRLLLQKLVAGVEAGIGAGVPTDRYPQSWDMLTRSGLLRESRLIEFCLARIAEEQIWARLDAAGGEVLNQLPAKLFRGPDAMLADYASALILAENLAQLRTPDALVAQLPADALHLLVWRVVAVFQSSDQSTTNDFVGAGHDLLSRHDEAKSLQSSAARLVYFLPEHSQPLLLHPLEAGPSLYVAALSHEFRLAHDRVLRLIDGDSIAPFLAMLRARDISAQAASEQLFQLRGQRPNDHQLPGLLDSYEQIVPAEARHAILQWRFGPEPGWKVG